MNTLERIQHVGKIYAEKDKDYRVLKKLQQTIINLGCNDGLGDTYSYIINNQHKIKEVHLLDCSAASLEKCKQLYKENVSPDFFKKIHFHHYAIIINENVRKIPIYLPISDETSGFVSTKPKMVFAHTGERAMIQLEVPAITINNFLKQINVSKVDRLYIDLEGLDADVLLNLDFNKYNVPYLMYEHLHLDGVHNKMPENPLKSNLLHDRLSQYGYSIFAYGAWNALALHKDCDLENT
tara:strand:- start:62 stop:775 length:714 start_codon:yes stop_codon:yes gene_type:complete